jgi:hypothetical protein
MIDFSNTIDETELNSRDSTEDPLPSGDLDLAITEFNAWYSPFPSGVSGYEGWNYECFKFYVYNIGDTYTGVGDIQILFTIIHTDGSEHTYSMMSGEYDGRFFKNMLICYHAEFGATPPQYCNAVQARLEIITTLPDINPENNVLTVDWAEGVTLRGQVHEKDISGNTNYVDYAEVISDSDCDKVIGSDKVASFGTPCVGDVHPTYTLVAPKDPEKSAYNYKIKADLYRELPDGQYVHFLRSQTKYSEPLNEMSYSEIFFTFFKLLNINQNSQSTPQSNPTSQTSSLPSSTTQQSAPSITTSTSMPATTTTTVTSTATTSKSTSLPTSR